METVPIPRLRLRVTTTAETIIRSGHPWLFADSIREENRAGRLGELAVIFDRYDRTFVLKLYTAVWLPRLDEVVGCLRASLHPQRLVLRLSRNIQSPAKAQGHPDNGQLLLGEAPDGPVTFSEAQIEIACGPRRITIA